MDNINFLWVLVCAALVFVMQAGFMCLESGLTRNKNSINVAIKNLADFGISCLLFWFIGYNFMFGEPSLNGWLGLEGIGFQIQTNNLFITVFFLFQLMFCGTAVTIISGAVAERMKFSSYLIVAVFVSGFIYPIYGHWAWGGAETGHKIGWLNQAGFIDFAGSSVVHSIGGWIAFAVLLIIGPRAGRFEKGQPPRLIYGHNIPLAILGALLLWLGWIGFNGGSTLTFNQQTAKIILNTFLAGSSGMIAAFLLDWFLCKIASVKSLVNGSLTGLVSITANCHLVTPADALVIGAIGGGVMLLIHYSLEHLQIDDAVGAVPVHVGGGVWGTLAVALFAPEGAFGQLTWIQQLLIQTQGIIVAFIWAFGGAFIFIYVLNKIMPIRVSPFAEEQGLNLSEHDEKTEIHDLIQVLQQQAITGNLHLRVQEDLFSDAGKIAVQYNRVLDKLCQKAEEAEQLLIIAQEAKQQTEQANNQLTEKIHELEKINLFSVERELRMISLKQEVNELAQQLGFPPRYRIDTKNMTPSSSLSEHSPA